MSAIAEADAPSSQRLPRGVSRTSWGNRFFSQIHRNGKRYYLGTFPTPEEASDAYQAAATALG